MKTLNDIDLAENERRAIEELAAALKSELPVTRVILFGSKARGTAEPDSDVDVLVLTSCPVTCALRDEVSDRAFEANLRHDVLVCPVTIWQDEWTDGLVRYLLIHSEVERDGCEV